jgi:WD40 repeat protein
MKLLTHAFSAISLLVGFSAIGAAQQPCRPPSLDRAAQGQNIFTDQQEMDLGDAVYERARREFKVIEDPVVTGYLQNLADRLIRNLPPTQIKFRLYLVDLPDANALTMPGGRIFVSRKMVAFVKNEDELAGVLAHELGHAFAHHSAIDFTELFRKILHVGAVTTRQDIFARYNQLIDEQLRRGATAAKVADHENDQQGAADLFGLYAVTLAGYDPTAGAELWERYAQTNGEPSGLLSRIFGGVPDDKKRAVAMRQQLARLPSKCITKSWAKAPEHAGEFIAWQRSVVAFREAAKEDMISNLLSAREITNPLKNEVRRAYFSPDGQYLLAQDDAGVTVLGRENLSILFHVDQASIQKVHFTPDSRSIVFQTDSLRVEQWDIASRKMRSASEVFDRKGCVQTELSPDGTLLGCLDSEFGLSLLDVRTGAVIFEHENFYTPSFWFYTALIWYPYSNFLGPGWPEKSGPVQMQFSPSGRYFVAGGGSSTTKPLAFDVMAKQLISLNENLRRSLEDNFTFVGEAKIVSLGGTEGSGRSVSFPDGVLIEKTELPGSHVFPATKGEWVILPSVTDNRIIRTAIDSTKVTVTRRSPTTTWRCAFDLLAHTTSSLPGQICLDVFQGTIAAQAPNGRLGLYDLKGAPPKLAKIDEAKYTRITAPYVTRDLKWLAYSNSAQGGVWDLETGERILYLPPFQAGYFTENGKFNARFENTTGMAGSARQFDLQTRQVVNLPEVKSGQKKYFGSVLVNWIDLSADRVKIDVVDAATLAPLWSVDGLGLLTYLYEVPNSALMAIQSGIESDFARKEIGNDPELKRRLNSLDNKKGLALLEVIEERTGRRTLKLIIKVAADLSSFHSVIPTREQIVISDATNRVTVYSLSTGEQKAAVFGHAACVDSAGNIVAVENVDGDLTVYDLTTYQPIKSYRLSAKIAMAQFSPDSTKLFVLTQEQKTYVIDTSAISGGKPATTGSTEIRARVIGR